MSETVLPTHETLLRLCGANAPNPWHPKAYVQNSGVDRGTLDALLNDLRLAGLLRLTDWQKSNGQGYLLTDLGKEVLGNPGMLAQLRTGLHKAVHNLVLPKPIDKSERPTVYDIGETARRAIYEPRAPRVMPVLLTLNLIAFGISSYVAQRMGVPVGLFPSQDNGRVLEQLGALKAADLIRGEWWRLLTCCFLHFGLLHLFVNMFSLYMLRVVESLFGPLRYLIIYLASGIGGSCVVMIWNPGTDKVVPVLAGASGAIWGLALALAAWLFLNRSYLNPQHVMAWGRSLGIVLLLNIGVSMAPGVSAAAHFGGGAVGFVVATLLYVQRFARPPRSSAALILLLLLPILGYKALTYTMANDPRWQQIAHAEALRRHHALLLHFKQEILPAVDRADSFFETPETDAYILTEKPAKDRSANKLAKLREDLAAANRFAKTALEKLGDKPLGDDQVEAARQAGHAYMQAIVEQIGRFEKLLDSEQEWDQDERNKTLTEVTKARIAWKEKRNQL